MNQILSIDNNNNKEKVRKTKTRNNAPIEIKSIVKFFSIAILIFGVFMVGSGSYSMYKEAEKATAKSKPEIRLEQITRNRNIIKNQTQ